MLAYVARCVMLWISLLLAKSSIDFDLLPVQGPQTLDVPLSAVGQLSNGCTGYLIGPCHVMTVAHCVYEPWKKIWWRGLEFHPGRNVGADGMGWSPLGSADKHDVRLHPNWTATAASSASDAAIIITRTPIGRRVGYFRHTPPDYIKHKQQQQQQQQQPPGQSASELSGLVSSQQLTLHIAGYPDNRANGSMWQQCCSVLDWQLQGNLLWHDCYARGGNSGSPIWVVWPEQQQPGHNTSTPQPSWSQVQAVGVHSSSLEFLKDSQLGVYAQQLYAEGIARAQQRQQQQATSGPTHAGVCTAMTTTLAATAGSSLPPAGSSGTTTPSRAAPVVAGQEAGAARSQASTTVLSAAAAAAAAGAAVLPGRPGGPAVAPSVVVQAAAPAVSRGRRLFAGAGGREEDVEHTLLPVAVPFHGDNFKWVQQVLQEFDRCPGE